MCKGISDHQKAGEMAQEADGDEAERASFMSAMDSCSEAGETPDFGGAAAFVTFGAGSDDGDGQDDAAVPAARTQVEEKI